MTVHALEKNALAYGEHDLGSQIVIASWKLLWIIDIVWDYLWDHDDVKVAIATTVFQCMSGSGTSKMMSWHFDR